ncbi:MAG: TetR/AcrR family transcriptional regulator [Firmicutes bacterium]|nr:TetR/AcrR family transcriptional regulator [Bacillota bacterium]
MTELTDRKHLVFNAIESLLLEEGPESLTYGNISARCHLHTNTITYYFNNKEDLMLQFFQHVIKRDTERKPVFFYRVEDGMSPVEAFSAFVDYTVDCKHLRSEVRRLINLYLLPHLYSSDAVRSLVFHINEMSIDAEYDAIQVYKKLGIIEETREREAFADLTFTSFGNSLLLIFGVECRDSDLALHNAKERIKKAFLKDGLYVETPWKESVD